MYVKLDILLVAMATLFSMSAAVDAETKRIVPLEDFQVYEGCEAKFSWKYEGDFPKGNLFSVYEADAKDFMIRFDKSKSKIEVHADFKGLVTLREDRESKTIVFTILKATSKNTHSYRLRMDFDGDAKFYEVTKLTVISYAEYMDFKKGSSLKINNEQTVIPADSMSYNVAPGFTTLESAVPKDFTQNTTCTKRSSGMRTPCGVIFCTCTPCSYNLYDTKQDDTIELEIRIDGVDDSKVYGYTLYVDESRTALASNQQASVLYITIMAFIVWISG